MVMITEHSGDLAGAIELLERASEEQFEGLRDYYIGAPLAALRGRAADAEAKIRDACDRGLRDPEAIFWFARTAARAGAAAFREARGAEILGIAEPILGEPQLPERG